MKKEISFKQNQKLTKTDFARNSLNGENFPPRRKALQWKVFNVFRSYFSVYVNSFPNKLESGLSLNNLNH